MSTLVTPWTVPCQTPLSMGLSRQEYWSGLPFPSPGTESVRIFYFPSQKSLKDFKYLTILSVKRQIFWNTDLYTLGRSIKLTLEQQLAII